MDKCLMDDLGIEGLCSISGVKNIDMNEALNITLNRLKFQSSFTITKIGNLVIWLMDQITIKNYSTCQKVLSPSVQNDLKLVMMLFRAEIYVGINIIGPTLLQVCGTKDPNLLIGTNQTIHVAEHCAPFPYNSIGDIDSIAKIHFSQRFNDTFRVFEDYGHYMVQTSLWPYDKYYLSRLIFSSNNTSGYSLPIPNMNVILHDCSLTDGSSLFLKHPPYKNHYYNKLIYIRHNKLCACVTENRNYFITQNITNDTSLKGYIYLRIGSDSYDPKRSIIFADYNAIYDYKHMDTLQVYVVFDIHFHGITNAYGIERSDITLNNEFWLNMTRFVDGQCTVTLYSFINDDMTYMELISGEKFGLRQTTEGITGFIGSRSTDMAKINYPGFLIKNAKCSTNSIDNDTIFNISSTPKFQIHRRLQRCRI